jgi:hypothetical protein
MDSDRLLDLDSGLTVTGEDRAALLRLRAQAPSWLLWNWRTLADLAPKDALAKRPIASDRWEPFHLY